ncbi:SDR family oxidoreductase [Paraburkholderia sp. J76]|uniref:SDR family oxidoreductase n=1 Tax=Paraburkholderia sp. J76 TaxID=2805439 RepID=UPI002ABDA534|nr:SDR family oxidoreductase [Paraburkholderia sp. J76]
MIIVTGATGNLGRRIVEQLLARMPAAQIGAVSREPARAAALHRAGVDVRQADFAAPDTLAAAFAGATQLLLVSSNAEAYGGDPLAQHRAAIAAARAAGVSRIVYTSHMGASPASAFPPMRNHASTEAMLRDSGMAWTALRNGFYASTLPMIVGDAPTNGLLAAPADGKVSWTAHDDLAEAAARILANEGCFEGPTPPLTATEALDLCDVAAVLSELTGKQVERTVIADEALASQMRGHGVPDAVVEITLAMYRASRAGEFAATDPALERLLGRKPATVGDAFAV